MKILLAILVLLAGGLTACADGQRPPGNKQAKQYSIACRFAEVNAAGKVEVWGEPTLVTLEGRKAEAQVGDRELRQILGGAKVALQVTVRPQRGGTVRLEAQLTRRSGTLVIGGFANIVGFLLGGEAAEPNVETVLTQSLHAAETIRLGKTLKLVLEKTDAGQPRCWAELTVRELAPQPESK